MRHEDILAAIPEDGWYVVLDGEQLGPISREALWSHLRQGAADAATYIWRQGFDEWKRLSEAPGWSELIAADGAEQETDDKTTVVPMGAHHTGRPESTKDIGGNLAAGGGASSRMQPGGNDDWDATLVEHERPSALLQSLLDERDTAHAAAAIERTASQESVAELDRTMLVPAGDLASASARATADNQAKTASKASKPSASAATAASDLDSLFGSDDDGPSTSADSGGFFDVAAKAAEPKLSHQRRETSVLFSLDDIDGKSAAKKEVFSDAKTDSGLIDIRAVAKKETRAQASRQTSGDLFADFASSENSVATSLDTRLDTGAAPLIQSKKSNKGLVWAIAALTLAVLGVGGYLVWQQQSQGTQVAQAPTPAAVPPAPTAPAAEPAAQATASPSEPPAAANPAPAVQAAVPAEAKEVPEPAASAQAAAPTDPVENDAPSDNAAAPAADAGAAGSAEVAAVAPTSDDGPGTQAEATNLAQVKPEIEEARAKAAKAAKEQARKIESKAAKLNTAETEVKVAPPTPPTPASQGETPRPSKGPSQEATALLGLVSGSSGGKTAEQPAAAPSTQGSSSGLPAQLSSNQIRKAVGSQQGSYVACYKSHGDKAEGAVTVQARLIVAGSGQVTSANIQGALSGSSVASCIEDKLRKVSFPAFDSPSQNVTVPLRLQ